MILNRFGLAAVLAACTLAACSDGSEDPAAAGPPADVPVVVATTSIWADIASQVLCGEQVDAVIPVGADPHTFEPSLRDRERLDGADLVVANGGGLEGSLSDLLDTVVAEGVNVVEMTPHIDVIAADDDHVDHDETDHDDEDHDETDHDEADHDDEGHGEADHDDEGHVDESHDETDHVDEGHGEADHDEHGHGIAADPHVWQDPSRLAGALDVIASAGTAIGLDDCNEEFAAELSDLDAEITTLLADIPPERRILVTSHDSLAYFADRYDLEVVGTVIPSTNTMAQTNAADLGDLADLIEERGVPAIFTERLESTADADALADRLGVTIVPLVTDALTDDPGTDTYVEMMRSNATEVAQALTP